MEPSIIGLALDAGAESDFEIFAQSLLHGVLGYDFEPTGGMHDGGQDGFIRPLTGRPNHYVQISTQKTYRDKIKGTVDRIRKSGRTIDTLTYVSPFQIADKDIVEIRGGAQNRSFSHGS